MLMQGRDLLAGFSGKFDALVSGPGKRDFLNITIEMRFRLRWFCFSTIRELFLLTSIVTANLRIMSMINSNFIKYFYNKPSDKTYWQFFLFLSCLIVICGTAIFIGAVPTRIFGHDIFFLLDNGWRVVNGQRPHIDFTSPWGPVSFLIVGIGLISSQNSVNAIGYGNAIFAFIIALWSYRLSRDRMGFIPRFLLCLYLALLVVSPYSLGWGVLNSGHAMFYNRYGYALLGLIMVEAFQRVGTDHQRREEWIGGISSGAVAAIALFLKANYFVAAVLLISISILFGRHSKWRFFGMIIGFTSVTLALLSYLNFDIAAIQRDLEIAAGARAKSFHFKELTRKLWMNAVYFVFIVLLCIQSSHAIEKTKHMYRTFKLPLLGALVFGVDMLLLCSNQQYSELPLTFIFSLFIVNNVIASNRNLTNVSVKGIPPHVRLTMLAGGVFFLFSLSMQFSGLAYGAFQKAWPSNLTSVARFTEPRLAALLLYDNQAEPKSNGSLYVDYINSGTRLLREKTEPYEKVLTMDMFNPFPYAIGRRPAVGGIAAAAYNYTLSDNHRPSDAAYFGNADIVMVPKQPSSPSIFYDGYFRIYEPALHDRFHLVAESQKWYLYRRK
jgi:hypothetical protein